MEVLMRDVTSAIAYNRRQRQRGQLTDEDDASIVSIAQTALGLADDGKLGPKTRAAVSAYFAPSIIGRAIVEVAERELGRGEWRWNNSGPDIARYRDLPWNPDKPTRYWGDWCAFFAGYVVATACAELGVPCDWRRFYDVRSARRMPVGSAKTLVRRMAEAGEFIAKDGELRGVPRAGDLFSIHRGPETRMRGHVGIVTAYRAGTIETIEGNVGGFPSYVKRLTRSLEAMRLRDIARI